MIHQIQKFSGNEITPYLDALAELRIKVFKDFPYLYDGDQAYEKKYLQRYVDCSESIVAICFGQNNKVVGATTGMPLDQDEESFQKTFLAHGEDIHKYFYFGESVLLKEYRGFGIGHKFFDVREQHAKSIKNIEFSTFCAVIRPHDHPLRPSSYKPLDEFWQKRGYAKKEGFTCELSWKDLNQDSETKKFLQFWSKKLF